MRVTPQIDQLNANAPLIETAHMMCNAIRWHPLLYLSVPVNVKMP